MDTTLPVEPINIDDTEDNINWIRKAAEMKKKKEGEQDANKKGEKVEK